MYDVRKIGFKIHKIARSQTNDIDKLVIRLIGQAISSGHMKEHSMTASDYAVKVIGKQKTDIFCKYIYELSNCDDFNVNIRNSYANIIFLFSFIYKGYKLLLSNYLCLYYIRRTRCFIPPDRF